jgi:hypothetical protein
MNLAEIRGANKLKIEVEGLRELQKQFDAVGKLPKKYLTKASKLGSDGPLNDARESAPKGKSGMLKRGLQRKMETPNKRNKAVYRIWFNPKYVEHYKGKKIKRPGLYGANPPREHGYYPISVEYGFKKKKGRVEGRYFVAKAIKKNTTQSLQKIIDSLNDSISTVLKQQQK